MAGPATRRRTRTTRGPLSEAPPGPIGARSRTRSTRPAGAGPVASVGTQPRWQGVALPHHHLAPEVADLLAPLVVAPALHRDNAPVTLGRRLPLVEHPRLGVDGVAVESR